MLKGLFTVMLGYSGSDFGAYYSRIQRQEGSRGPTADEAKDDYQRAVKAKHIAGTLSSRRSAPSAEIARREDIMGEENRQ